MPGWTLVDTHPIRGRTFERPLDTFELPFFWDGLFAGITDNIHHAELRLVDGSRDANLFSTDNITRAWLSTKRRYPLSGATMRPVTAPLEVHLKEFEETHQPIPGSTQAYFVIREHDLTVLRPHEIVFEQVASVEEVQKRIVTLFHGPRQISNEFLTRLYVFRETGSERSDVLHFVILESHCVADWRGRMSFVRCLFDTLSRGGRSEPDQISFEERLATMVPPLGLEPAHLRSLSPAKRRWRRVVGKLIFRLRMQKTQGGHTLPCRFTRSTPCDPPRTSVVATSLTGAQSAEIFLNCHLHNITFGSAFPVLGQIAMTPVLYRRYLRGEISEEEWEYRKKQPYINFAPFDLRPYLDRAWFKNDGGGEFVMSSSRTVFQLPFMTLGTPLNRGREMDRCLLSSAPPFSDLLTFDRFLHRVGLVKKQMAAIFGHPLSYEIASAATNLVDVERSQIDALEWMKRVKTDSDSSGAYENADQDEVLAVKDRKVVAAHGGSSLGDADLIIPFEYPIPPSHPLSPYSSLPHPVKAGYVTPPPPLLSAHEVDVAPKIVLEDWTAYLQVRPGNTYLGAATWRGRLKMQVCYDVNVFEEVVVREWLEEIKEAALWYLGGTTPGTMAARVQAKL